MYRLLSFLLFAVFFYLMMRFGCGAHMVHGGHDHKHGPKSVQGHGMGGNSVNDPVCGMAVEPGQGYSKHAQGQELRFCSRQCLDKFEAEPQRYLS
jgi:YHS domain-containing protein